MTGLFRIRYREGDFELEVESSERAYADEKFAELLRSTSVPAQLRTGKPGKNQLKRSDKTSNRHTTAPTNGDAAANVPVADIVNAVHEAKNHAEIEKHILGRRGVPARILLCFTFAESLGVEYLKTTHVEAITDGLGVKIDAANVAKSIREGLKKYLSADGMRRQGVPTNYKLNRRGREAYKKLVKGEKSE